MNLLAKRAQIKLASDGVNLLKGKREALLKELIERAKALRTLRQELQRRGTQSAVSTAMARAVRGTPEVRSTAVAGRRDMHLDVTNEKVWGLSLGTIKQNGIVRDMADRSVGTLDMSSHILEAAEEAERMLQQLIECAPAERNLMIIGEEVRKVSRRINALEEYLLPRLRDEVHSIYRVLDEREREDTFRLKRIKQKKSGGAKASKDEVQEEFDDSDEE
jgi:V/A-type H+-transporting ATPase subunit D